MGRSRRPTAAELQASWQPVTLARTVSRPIHGNAAAGVKLIADHLVREHIPVQSLGVLFDELDTNGDDALSEEEFRKLLGPLLTKLSRREIQEIHNNMSDGHDGITKQDFVERLTTHMCGESFDLSRFTRKYSGGASGGWDRHEASAKRHKR